MAHYLPKELDRLRSSVKVGDLVIAWQWQADAPGDMPGIIIGFNKKGEGGQHYVHVWIDGAVQVYRFDDLKIIRKSNKNHTY